MIPEDDQTPAEAGLEEFIAARLGGTTSTDAPDLLPMPLPAVGDNVTVAGLPAEAVATARDLRRRLNL